ncbi:unnamed protein product [Lota lota]
MLSRQYETPVPTRESIILTKSSNSVFVSVWTLRSARGLQPMDLLSTPDRPAVSSPNPIGGDAPTTGDDTVSVKTLRSRLQTQRDSEQVQQKTEQR